MKTLFSKLDVSLNWNSAERRFFWRWMGLSLVFHLLAAYFSVGYHSADEQFQILEFLSFKMGNVPKESLPVEYVERMRPWLQPAVYYVIVRWMGLWGMVSPHALAYCFRLVSGLLGWASLVGLGFCSKRWFDRPAAFKSAVIIMATLWFLPALHVRPSSESWGGSAFLLGLAFLVFQRPFWGGFFLSWSFESRFQMGIMIAGALSWFMFARKTEKERLKLKDWLHLAAGFSFVFLLGRLADYWGHGDWSFSPWNYVSYNLVRGNVNRFSDHPWWDVFRMAWTESWPVLGEIVAVSTVVAWVRNPKHLLTWSQVPFFLVHELIRHKEFRFFFPIASAAPVLLVQAFQSEKFWNVVGRRNRKLLRLLIALLFAFNGIALVALTFVPFSRVVAFYEAVYKSIPAGSQRYELFVTDRDPFEILVHPIYFYRPQQLSIVHVPSYDAFFGELNRRKVEDLPLWLFYPALDPAPVDAARLAISCRLEYSTLPIGLRPWLERINFYNWLSRTNAWLLYRCGR